MKGLEKNSNVVQVALVMALALVLGACDADSPTAPTQTANPPVSTSATAGFAISVGLSPTTVVIGEEIPVTVTVVARRTDTNQPVPRGSTALLSTTSGALTNADASATGVTVSVTFDVNGQAQASLAGVTEDAVIRAQIDQSTGEATLRVSEAPAVTPFTLIGTDPNFGPPSGGTEVQIQGTGFSLPAEVGFGGIAVPVLSITSSTIRVRSPQIDLPSGQNRVVSISVSVNVGEEDFASGSLGSAFTYTRNQTPLIPKIISITPTTGPNEGRTRVTLFGEAFGSEVQVFFGSSSLIEAELLDVSPTRILVETPPATGQNSGVQNSVVAVRVRDLRSGFEAILANAFQYGDDDQDFQITAISPGEGLYLGGTLVTLFSTGGFEAPVAVEFGGEAQQVVSVSGTEIVARAVPVEVSCSGQAGATSVVNIETGETFSGPSFSYETITPEIGSFAPESVVADVITGAIAGTTTMTMGGSGFDRQSRPPRVTFGDEEANGVTITSLDSNPAYDGYGIGDIMTIGIPPAPVPWPEEDCTSGGADGVRYTDQNVSLTVTVRDTGCSAAATFTYFPSDGTCRVPTPPDPDPVTPVAQFSFSVAGTVVTVSDLSSNTPTSIQWDFGDGAVENGTPGESGRMHDYAGAASGDMFSVKLRATNSAGTGEITKTVTIP